ncbi:putative HTH-type transcriptional regulator [BD1-7 clade bacterium]|uniref:Putative HTH-type transcriptional regulator n=1 Tax=BD1-7 clade bacterium TaxID=2029982 RepID=A0A5S9NXJ5_9GAMM|nr:putative HTH-type transcriptional regulator [BD1-7 clade bacterium]
MKKTDNATASQQVKKTKERTALPLQSADLEAFRSNCALASALDIIGDKWSLLLVRDLMFGIDTFSKLQSRPETIPSNILASRLKRLQGQGLIEKTPYQERPVRYRYTLTSVGWALKPILLSLTKWGLDNIEGAVAPDFVRDHIEATQSTAKSDG